MVENESLRIDSDSAIDEIAREFFPMRTTSIATLLLGVALNVFAQHGTSATQTLALVVKPIAVFSVTGDPQPMVITTTGAGTEIMTAEDRSTRFTMTTNTTGRRIAVSLNAPMPVGTKLMIRLADGTGTSNGMVDLSNALTPVTAVSDLQPGLAADQEIAYTFLAEATAGPVPPQSRTITFTVTE